jgi:hypothetical protein
MLSICELQEKSMRGFQFLSQCKQIVEDEEQWIVDELWDEEHQGHALDIELDRLDGNQKALSDVLFDIFHFQMSTIRKKNQFLKIDMLDNECECPGCQKSQISEGKYLQLAEEVKNMNDLYESDLTKLILSKLLEKKLVGKNLDTHMKKTYETMHKIIELQWSGYLKKKVSNA